MAMMTSLSKLINSKEQDLEPAVLEILKSWFYQPTVSSPKAAKEWFENMKDHMNLGLCANMLQKKSR